jgi:hypothetical protein
MAINDNPEEITETSSGRGAQTTQERGPTMQAQPQKEHQWLKRLVGEWTYEVESTGGPAAGPEKSTGVESVRSVGELWVVAEGQGQMPGGGAAQTMLTLGYDPQKKQYVGTWLGSMMTHLWVYQGEVDGAGKTLTLDTEGPSMVAEARMAKYRERIEFESDDHRIFSSQMLTDDGQWRTIMTAHYRRTSH